MLKVELHEVKEINRHHKERDSGKHIVLKDTPVVSTEEVERALKKAEKVTKGKKKAK